MNAPSLNIILEYLYDKFILTFILCLIGAIIRETMNTMKATSIDIKRMMASVVMSSTIMCIVADYIEFQFSIYIVVCIIVGVWSPLIMKIILDSKIMAKVLGTVLGGIKTPIAKTASEVINELEEDNDKSNTSEDDNIDKKEDAS